MARLVAVAATDEEAEQVARTGAAWTIGAYAHGAGATSIGFEPDGEVAARVESYVRERSSGDRRRGCATSSPDWPR